MRQQAYRVKDWSALYENNRTREMKNMQWVPVPIKHDGEGYMEVMSHPNGLKIFACWILILETAAKSHPRGTLLRRDGTPLGPRSIATKTSCADIDAMTEAFAVLSSPQVGWLESFTVKPAVIPQECAENPQEPARKGIEGKGSEGREVVGGAEQENKTTTTTISELPNDPTYGEMARYLMSGHREYAKLSEHQIIAAFAALRGTVAKPKMADAVRELVRHYAGDAPLEMAPIKRLESYLRGATLNKRHATGSQNNAPGIDARLLNIKE